MVHNPNESFVRPLGVPDANRWTRRQAGAAPAGNQSDATPPRESPEQQASLGIPRHEQEHLGPVATHEDLFARTDDTDSTAAAEAALASDDRISVSSVIGDPKLLALIVIVSGGVLLFLGSQALTTLHLLATLPTWMQWIGYPVVVAVSLIVLVAVGYLMHQYLRLRQTPQVRLHTLLTLHERAASRHATSHHTVRARQMLERFLREYPLEPRHTTRLSRLGFDMTQDIEPLRSQRQRLCDAARGSDQMWLLDVDKHFIRPLDGIARRRVRRYAVQVGLKTAIAPSGFLDACIAVVYMYLLVADICQIYNLRASRWGTFLILTRVFVTTVIAGQLDEAIDPFGENLAETLRESIGGFLAGAAGMLASRATDGTANGLLLARLGSATVRHVRPIALEKSW
jgi:putative membrane protein